MIELTIRTTPEEHYLSPWCMKVVDWEWATNRPLMAFVPRLSVSLAHITVAAEPGSILAYGRKNVKNLKRNKSIFHYAVVTTEGQLFSVDKASVAAFFRKDSHGRI